MLIDPILRLVGWPPEDPAAVVVEYQAGKGRADYVLLGEDGRPVALLEAKALGKTLEAHTLQIVTYATETGIGFAGITDGDRWTLYDVFRRVPMEDKRVLDVTLTHDEPLAVAVELLAWLARLKLPQLPSDRSPGPARSPQARARVPTGEWTAIVALEEPPAITAGAEIRFPDGKMWNASTWQQAVGRVAEWLVTSGRLAEDRLPLQVETIVHGIHWDPVHSDGAPFHRKHEFSAPSGRRVYVHTHGKGTTSVKYIRSMLRSCGIAEQDVFIRVL